MNNTENKTVIHLFEEQVEKTPNDIAVVFKSKKLTYRQLNDKVNQLVNYISSLGYLEKGDSISICIKKSEFIIVTLLGVIKCGCSYVLLDQNLPEKRIRFITNNSKSKLIIDDVFLKNFLDSIDSLDKNNPNINIQLRDIIYLMYTSGTTGNPKGAINTHNGFLNTLKWYVNDIGIEKSTRVGIISNLSFDLTQKNYFAPLLVGASIYISDDFDLANLDHFIKKNEVTLINCAPTLFYTIIEYGDENLKSLKKVILGGEHINYPIIVNFVHDNQVEVFNSYGPSEASDVATFYKLTKKEVDVIPIGKPIRNTTIFLLDKDLQPVASGVEAEIYIGGIGVGIGYFNEEKLTDEKFITTNKFGRIYKTGDWGRLNANQNLEFLGRKDGQIKIRGNRIEIEGIENQIHNFDKTIKRVIVDIKEVNEEKTLIAYYESQNEIDKFVLRKHLGSILPSYMVPNHFVQLKKIPLNPNGKVSKKDLPQIDLNYVQSQEYIKPSNDLEKKLLKVWQNVFRIEKIGVTDDFFELGGDSLKSLRTISKINILSKIKINVNDLYEHSTIKSLSSFISNKQIKKSSISLKSEIEDLFRKNLGKRYLTNNIYEASFDQLMNWKMLKSEKYGKRIIKDNIRVMEFLDRDIAIKTVHCLFKKHQILNICFNEIDGILYQEYHDTFNVENTIDFVNKQDVDKSYINGKLNSFNFNLTNKSPLIHFLVIKSNEYFDLTLISNHLLIDGWSSNILKKDFSNIYLNLYKNLEYEYPLLNTSYLDFSVWQKKLLSTKKIKEEYFSIWNEYLKNLHSKCNITYDNVTTIKDHHSSFEIYLSPQLTEKIRSFSFQNRVSVFSILLASLFKLIHKNIGEQYISVGIANPNRPFDELFDVVGEFANASVVVQDLVSSEDSLGFSKKVNQNLNTVLELPVLPFKELGLQHKVTELFSIMLNMISYEELKDTKVTQSKHISKVAIGRWEIGIYIYEYKEVLKLNIRYNPNLYLSETIEELTYDYIKQIDELVK